MVLGGVVEPGAVLMVEEDWFDGALLEESLDRLLEDFSVLKLLLDSRRRSCRKDGIVSSWRR